MNNNTKLTFNETTYEFNYFLGRAKHTPNDTYACYGVYINGALDTNWFLQKDKDGSYDLYNKIPGDLHYESEYCNLTINDFTLESVVKVISHIRRVIGDNLLNGLVENPNNFDDLIPIGFNHSKPMKIAKLK